MTKLEQAEQLLSEMTRDEMLILLGWLIRDLGGIQATLAALEQLETLEDERWAARARQAAKNGFASPEETGELLLRVLGEDSSSD